MAIKRSAAPRPQQLPVFGSHNHETKRYEQPRLPAEPHQSPDSQGGGRIGDRRLGDEDRHSVHAAVAAAQFQMMFTGRNIRNDEIDDRHALVVDLERADLDRIGGPRSDELAHLCHLPDSAANRDETGPQVRTGLHDNLIGTEPAMRACHCSVSQRGEQHLTTAVRCRTGRGGSRTGSAGW